MIDSYRREIDYLRISVTDLCNLRCRYCMPPEGIIKRSHDDMLTVEETADAVKAAVSIGIRKVRITGGEPLVKRGIVSLCREISGIDGVDELCMTTNGTLLAMYADDLRRAGVSRVNISLDTLDPEKYKHITRLGKLRDVLEGIDAASEAGFNKIKINTVLMGGFNDDEIQDFGELTMKRNVDVRFIELMPVGCGADFEKDCFVSTDIVKEKLPELKPLGLSDGAAEMYALPGACGRIGLINTISGGFCSSCNKIRLTADGMIKPCLHTDREISIKGKPRDEMRRLMIRTVKEKPFKRDVLDAYNPSPAGRTMNRIGG